MSERSSGGRQESAEARTAVVSRAPGTRRRSMDEALRRYLNAERYDALRKRLTDRSRDEEQGSDGD